MTSFLKVAPACAFCFTFTASVPLPPSNAVLNRASLVVQVTTGPAAFTFEFCNRIIAADKNNIVPMANTIPNNVLRTVCVVWAACVSQYLKYLSLRVLDVMGPSQELSAKASRLMETRLLNNFFGT